MKVLFAIGDLPEHLEHTLARKGFKEDRFFDWPTDQLPEIGNYMDSNVIRQIYGAEISNYSVNVIDRLELTENGVILPVVIVGVQG